MQQDEPLKNRIQPPKMDHLAEQIVARSKDMPQGVYVKKTRPFAGFFKMPQLSYALAFACCVLFISVVVTQNISTTTDQATSHDVALQDDDHWDDFWNLEEETMFAGL